MIINIKKLNEDAITPTYARAWDAGADLYAIESLEIPANTVYLASTGIAVEIPSGYVGLIHPRSSLAMKAVTVMNAPGTIDAGYRGEVKVLLCNHSSWPYKVEKGDKIAQLVIQEVIEAQFVEVAELSDSTRGTGGFGSTGV